MEALLGVTAMEERVAPVVVRRVEPAIVPEVAVIVVVPFCVVLLANPLDAIVAILVLEELQLTEVVIFAVLPSVYVPVAVNCSVAPARIDGFAGVTAIDTSAGGTTVTNESPRISPRIALTVTGPGARPVARPVLVKFITWMFSIAFHATCELMSCVVPLL